MSVSSSASRIRRFQEKKATVIDIRTARRKEIREVSSQSVSVGKLKFFVLMGLAGLGFAMAHFIGII